MHYHATIKPASDLHNRWRRMGRLVMALEGTRFVWRGSHFVSTGEIADLPALLRHHDVLVEAVGRAVVAPPESAPAPPPVPPAAPAPTPVPPPVTERPAEKKAPPVDPLDPPSFIGRGKNLSSKKRR